MAGLSLFSCLSVVAFVGLARSVRVAETRSPGPLSVCPGDLLLLRGGLTRFPLCLLAQLSEEKRGVRKDKDKGN